MGRCREAEICRGIDRAYRFTFLSGLKYQKKGVWTMGVYEELVARGLIAQVTNEEEIKKMVNEGKAGFLHRL